MNTANMKTFFSYVIPSVLAFALSGVYTIVDGFFIGQSLGDVGLASITLGYPVSALPSVQFSNCLPRDLFPSSETWAVRPMQWSL